MCLTHNYSMLAKIIREWIWYLCWVQLLLLRFVELTQLISIFLLGKSKQQISSIHQIHKLFIYICRNNKIEHRKLSILEEGFKIPLSDKQNVLLLAMRASNTNGNSLLYWLIDSTLFISHSIFQWIIHINCHCIF